MAGCRAARLKPFQPSNRAQRPFSSFSGRFVPAGPGSELRPQVPSRSSLACLLIHLFACGSMSLSATSMPTASTAPVRELFAPGSLDLPKAKIPRAEFLTLVGFLGDALAALGGLVLGHWIRFQSGWITFGVETAYNGFRNYIGLIVIGAVFLLLTFGYLQLYHARRVLRYREAVSIIFKGLTFWGFAFISATWVLQFRPPCSRIYVVTSYLACLATLLAWRWAYHRVLQRPTVAKTLRQRVLFVGWTPEAQRMSERMAQDPGQPYHIAGWIPAPLGRRDSMTPLHIPELGDCSELPRLLRVHEIDVVILADLGLAYEEIVGLANLCEKELVQFKIIPSYFQILLSGLKLEPVSGVPVLGVSELPLDRFANRLLKRVMDVIGAVVGLVLTAPCMAVCGLLITLESPGPVFYRQTRTGRNGKNFTLYKLRSMRLDAEADGRARWASGNEDPRCLRIGRFMRKWKLDEFPQFWNVLKGDMSLVGPRPERPELISRFRNQVPHYNARLTCKPGITGWAQVNGLLCNSNLEERIRHDLHYLENWSLWLDLQTLFQTCFIPRYNAY